MQFNPGITPPVSEHIPPPSPLADPYFSKKGNLTLVLAEIKHNSCNHISHTHTHKFKKFHCLELKTIVVVIYTILTLYQRALFPVLYINYLSGPHNNFMM